MHQEKGSVAVSDSVYLNGSSEEMHATKSFIQQAMEIIDEGVKKATNVKEKVIMAPSCSFLYWRNCFLPQQKTVSGELWE